MIGLEVPQLLLLALPVTAVWWWSRDRQPVTQVVRLVAVLLLVAALAAPYLRTEAPGRDLVIVVDRSRSMPEGALESARELIRLAERQRGAGDRVALVSFGARVALERSLSPDARFDEFERSIDPDGSALADALDSALELIPDGRAGSIFLLSDGEVHGRDPLPAARRAFGRELHIDVRPYPRPGHSDLAVERIDLPEVVARNEPFQFSAWIRTDSRRAASYVLERDGAVVARGQRIFEVGLTRLVFRDRVESPGLADYQVRILGVDDRVPENNRGRNAVRVEGSRGVLVINDQGQVDNLVNALRAAQMAVDVTTPEEAAIDLYSLEAYRAVVIENVAAGRFSGDLTDLRRFVRERAGGLLLTGGAASFGIGGYYLSPIDEILPVSMEMRQEQRKQGMALVIAMDRSGSMMAPVAGGQTKMDLANLGAAAAIGLLSAVDSTAVIAVDSDAHVIQELTPVEDTGAIISRVRRIESMGGGIFVHEALVAAVKELEKAKQLNRHN